LEDEYGIIYYKWNISRFQRGFQSMKVKQKSLLVFLTILMVITIVMLDKMGLKKTIEACESHEGLAEVKEGILSWNVSCEEK
jgi:hypothetical protein